MNTSQYVAKNWVEIKPYQKPPHEPTGNFSVTLKVGHDTTKGLQALEANYLEFIYKESRYNKSKAARMLGITRNTLGVKLKKYFGNKYL